MPAEILRASSSLLSHVADPAARSIVLGCCAAAILGVLRVKNVTARLVVWRGVLAVALAMPLLAMLVLPVQVRMPEPLAKYVAAKATPESSASEDPVAPAAPRSSVLHEANPQSRPIRKESAKSFATTTVATFIAPTPEELRATPNTTPASVWRTIPWGMVGAAIYLVIALTFLARMWLGIRFATRLERSSTEVKDARALEAAASAARTNGITWVPRLAESEMLSVPVTLGVRKTTILFPGEWRDWEEGELEAVLAHEISHVARRDALVQRLALIHRAIFWFSPFAWWLERHLVDLCEQASDEAALASGADRTRYAETLLGFFATLEAAPQRVWWQGVSMAQLGQAEKRVDRILAWSGAMSKRLTRPLMVGLIAVAAPVVLLTASVHPTVNNFQEPVVDPEPQATTPPAPRPTPVGAAPAQPAAAPTVAAQTMPPMAPDASLDSMTPPVANAPVTPMAAVASMVPMGPPAIQEGLPTPPAIAGNSDEVQEAYEAAWRAQEALAKANRQIAGAKERAANSATEEHLAAVKNAMAAYKAAMASYKATLKQYHTNLAEAREIAAAAQSIGVGVAGGVYGGVSGGVGGGVQGDHQYRIAGSYSGDWGPRFVIVTKGSGDVTMSGTEEDAEHARSLRSKISGDFIWFERDEKSYIITDSDFISKAKALFAPQEELARKQDELGRQQDELGKQQDALGKKMDEVKVKIPDITPNLQRVHSELDALRQQQGVSQRELGRLQSELARLQSEIGRYQSDAGRQQGDIGRQQGELGRKQGELGRQQGELGRQQGDLARKASRELREMFSAAIDKGIAKPE